MTYPIVYKIIPTQYAFYVHEDGTLEITPVTKIAKTMKFENEKEAREFIKNYKEQL